MSNDQVVSEHYTHGGLLKAIQASLLKLSKTIDNITIEDLAPVDEFHIGGRLATEHFVSQLDISEQDHLLDVGCGLGGAARYIADKYNNRVTGIDLTQEYIDTGNALCGWLKLDKHIGLHQGSALSMPFKDESFDAAYMLHVGMNIEDKNKLFNEIDRVIKPGGSFGVYDIMKTGTGDLRYPVPWASYESNSYLATPDQYKNALGEAGFEIVTENNRRVFALDFFKKVSEKNKATDGSPPLGLHTLMQESATVKIKNMVHNLTIGVIAPVEIVVRKN